VSIHLSTVHVGETSNIHETFDSITSFEMAIGDHTLGDAETVAPFSLLVDGADDMLLTTNIDSHCHSYFNEAFVETPLYHLQSAGFADASKAQEANRQGRRAQAIGGRIEGQPVETLQESFADSNSPGRN
jgi:hypothetical protein